MDNRIRMRHLRCFVEVARHGSITRAAEALNTVQPSLSRSLRELEDEIGSPLFERTGRGLVLTGAGERLMRHASIGLAQIAKGVRQAQEKHAIPAVSVGILPNVARTLAPRAIGRFKRREPEIDVRVYFHPVNALVDYLHDGTIDFMLGRLLAPERLKGISFEHLYSEPLIFVARPDHPLAARPGVTLADIDAGIVVVPLPGTIIRAELDKFTVARGLAEFSNKIESVSFELMRAVLADGDAVACIPVEAAGPELADGKLVRLAIETAEMTSSVGLSYLAGRDLNPAAADLAGIIRDEAAIRAFS